MEFHKAARLDGGTELRPLYRHEIGELARPRETQRFHCQDSGRLSNGLHEQYTRHDWPPGKMPLKERLVDRNRLYCMDGLFKFHCFHAVNKQHRKTMRQRGHHGPDVQWPPDHIHRLCRSEEHTSELQSLMRISYAVFCLKQKNHN